MTVVMVMKLHQKLGEWNNSTIKIAYEYILNVNVKMNKSKRSLSPDE